MSGKVTWLAWVKLIEENEVWARTQPRTLEREHVLAILADIRTNRAYYDAQPERRAASPALQQPYCFVCIGTCLHPRVHDPKPLPVAALQPAPVATREGQ